MDSFPYLDEKAKKANMNAYLEESINKVYVDTLQSGNNTYRHTKNLSPEIADILTGKEFNLSIHEQIIYNKIYLYYKDQETPLTPEKLKKLIRFGKCFNFDQIGPKNQELMLMDVVAEIQAHPLLEQTFLEEYPDQMKLTPYTILWSPNYQEDDVNGLCSSSRNEIFLNDFQDMSTFFHEIRHAQQNNLGLSAGQEATKFYTRLGKEAESAAYTNLIKDEIDGFGKKIYDQTISRYPDKLTAEKKYIGILMELYLAPTEQLENILKKHDISYTQADFLALTHETIGWHKGYTDGLSVFIIESLSENDTTVDEETLKKINRIYRELYNNNDIDIEIDSPQMLTLHCAGATGDIDIVREALKSGQNVNYNKFGFTPLILAVQNGNLEIVRELINAGADVNAQADWKTTPLKLAAKYGYIEIVRELIHAGADINARDDLGCTPLMWAVQNGNLEIVRELIHAGAHVNIPDNWNTTPLIEAAQNGHIEIVRELIHAGADMEVKKYGKTALMMAIEKGDVNITQELIRAGADINAQDDSGHTPLMFAARNGHVEIVQLLLENNADIFIKTDNGLTASDIASVNDHPEIAHILKNQEVILALKQGNIEYLSLAISQGVDVNIKDKDGYSLLQIALMNDYPEAAKLLIEADANVHETDPNGNTPLILAASKGYHTVVESLITHGADITQTNDYGNSALFYAQSHSHSETIQVLEEAQKQENATENPQTNDKSSVTHTVPQSGTTNRTLRQASQVREKTSSTATSTLAKAGSRCTQHSESPQKEGIFEPTQRSRHV